MADIIDLSALGGSDDELPGMWEHADFIDTSDGFRIDPSGKPAPTNVVAVLDSGVHVKCEVRYDGLDAQGFRRYLAIAEIDWENYYPKALYVGTLVDDVSLSLLVPGVPDDVHQQFAKQLEIRLT